MTGQKPDMVHGGTCIVSSNIYIFSPEGPGGGGGGGGGREKQRSHSVHYYGPAINVKLEV